MSIIQREETRSIMSSHTATAELRALNQQAIVSRQADAKTPTTTVFVRLMRRETYLIPSNVQEFKVISGRVWMVQGHDDFFVVQGETQPLPGAGADPRERLVTAIGPDPVVLSMQL
jgi:hypothetical protein